MTHEKISKDFPTYKDNSRSKLPLGILKICLIKPPANCECSDALTKTCPSCRAERGYSHFEGPGWIFAWNWNDNESDGDPCIPWLRYVAVLNGLSSLDISILKPSIKMDMVVGNWVLAKQTEVSDSAASGTSCSSTFAAQLLDCIARDTRPTH